MKILIVITVFIYLNLGLFDLLRGQTYVTEKIDADTRWTNSGSPYVIMNDILISEGVTLNIEPGTEILFSAETKILVYGTLCAKGKKSKKISFSGKGSMPWNGFEYFRTCGQYDTLTSKGCFFQHCNFTGVGDAPGQLIRSRGCNIKISDCIIKDCYTAVQSERQARIIVQNNQFISCNRPINVRNSSLADIKGNKFVSCNSIVLGGTTNFSENILKKFSDNGIHSGLVVWMLGGGIVTISKNRFLDFEGYALKIQKMNKRATLIFNNNYLKNNLVNIKLNCAEAGKGNFNVDSNDFISPIKTQIEIFGECIESANVYQFSKNYWGKKSFNKNQASVKIEEESAKSFR
jgi:hypothetical protein